MQRGPQHGGREARPGVEASPSPAQGIGTQPLEKKEKQSPCETGKFLLPERNALPCLRDQADFAWPSRRARTLAMPKLAGLPRLPETEAQTGDRGTDSLPTASPAPGNQQQQCLREPNKNLKRTLTCGRQAGHAGS